jgi:4-alpha-glucanotransferase
MNPSRNWLDRRNSGVLAHITSLPSPFGVGNLGLGARKFVDFLQAHGFRYWQICPVGPTGYGDSPYQSFSTFAGNPYMLDLEPLIAEGYLQEEEVQPLKNLPREQVDFGELYLHFWDILAQAESRYRENPKPMGRLSLEAFIREESSWLPAYSLFMALKKHHGGKSWHLWQPQWRQWENARSAALPDDVALEQRRHQFYQYCFFLQWEALRDYARDHGVGIIGDIPIFVSYDSADCWSDRELFMLDGDGLPTEVAGVPPDYFSEYGQLWGNPLYNWPLHRENGYAWWLRRAETGFRLFDVIRLDHFRGFDSYWAIPAGAKDARNGRWLRAPGEELFRIMALALPNACFIAEDLGYITEDVFKLLKSTGFPGMKVLQFAFGHDSDNINLPHNYDRHCVVYSGTHDNDTTRGWLHALDAKHKAPIRSYFNTDDSNSAWPLIRAAFASVSYLAIVPIQDLMDLPSEARFNLPGTSSGNWKWRFTEEQLDRLVAKRGDQMIYWHQLYGRDGNLSPSTCSVATTHHA